MSRILQSSELNQPVNTSSTKTFLEKRWQPSQFCYIMLHFFFLFLEIAPHALSSLQVHFGTCENMLKVTQKRKRLMRHTAVAYFRPHKQNMILLILSIQTWHCKIYTYNTNDNQVSPCIPVLQWYLIYTILHKNQKYMYKMPEECE